MDILVSEFARLVAEFRYEEAHKLFYDVNLVKHENEDAPTIGIKQHKAAMDNFLSNIKNEKARLISTSIVSDTSVCIWQYTFDHALWGFRSFEQVSVQRWSNGKIVHERHHYQK